ncbi:MAG: carbohydrate ABC transporter permease [Sphaerochaeta sp.]
MAESYTVTEGNYFRKKKIQHGILYAILTIVAIYTLAPLYFLVVNSFKSNVEIIASPLAFPTTWSASYIVEAAKQIHFFSSLVVTAFVTVLSVLLIVLVSSIGAWIMVRNKTKASNFVYLLFTAAMLIPFQSVMYPLIQIFGDMGLKNIPGLIIMYGGFGLAMSTFLYHGFVKGVPLGVEEAALIDGCNIFQIYSNVVMPLLQSVTVTVIILNSMWIWNDYLLPFLVIGNSTVRAGGILTTHKTLTLELYFARILAGQYGNPWQLIFPSVFISIIPMVVVFLSLQKYIVKGVAAGAIKS